MDRVMSRVRSAKPRRSPEVAIIAWAVVAALIGPWWQRDATPPALVIPTPAMPAHNAFDVFQAAANAEVQRNVIDGFAPTPAQRPSQAAVAAAVAANAPALRLLHQGLALPYQSPPVRSFSTPIPYYAGFRGLARLLNQQGVIREQAGDWAGAVDARLNAVALGTQIPHGGNLIAMLVGIACQAIGRKALWSDIPFLTAPQARAAARRMEAISARQVPFAATLQEDEWSGQAGLLEAFHSPTWRHDLLVDANIFGVWDKARVAPLQAVQYPFLSRGDILRDYTRYMDDAVRDAHRLYAAPDPAPPGDLFCQGIAPPYRLVRHKVTGNETQNALLTAALALRAYRLEHGTYPPALNALVPGYLTHVPADPFAASRPLRYHRTGTSSILYSVGPDGTDDGGRPISGPMPYNSYSRPDSKGDIVAGVNLF